MTRHQPSSTRHQVSTPKVIVLIGNMLRIFCSLSSPKLSLARLVVVCRTGLSTSGPLQTHSAAVEHLALCGRVRRICLVGVRVDIAAIAAVAAVSWRRCHVRGRSPAHAAHVRASSSAARSMAVLDARLKRGGWQWRAIADRVRGWPDIVGVAS